MGHVGEDFLKAAADYRFLLGRNYSRKSVIKLVGDRYQLRSVERSMLCRGIDGAEQSRLRHLKLLRELPANAVLYVDGYNVIRTMGSYLTGKKVFVSSDGYLRDAAEMHRDVLKSKIMEQVLGLLFQYLADVTTTSVTIYLDEPISKSGELAVHLNNTLEHLGMTGSALTVHSPDHLLKKVHDGIICTADSAIIDTCNAKVFDLARVVLDINYHPDLTDLSELMD